MNFIKKFFSRFDNTLKVEVDENWVFFIAFLMNRDGSVDFTVVPKSCESFAYVEDELADFLFHAIDSKFLPKVMNVIKQRNSKLFELLQKSFVRRKKGLIGVKPVVRASDALKRSY